MSDEQHGADEISDEEDRRRGHFRTGPGRSTLATVDVQELAARATAAFQLPESLQTKIDGLPEVLARPVIAGTIDLTRSVMPQIAIASPVLKLAAVVESHSLDMEYARPSIVDIVPRASILELAEAARPSMLDIAAAARSPISEGIDFTRPAYPAIDMVDGRFDLARFVRPSLPSIITRLPAVDLPDLVSPSQFSDLAAFTSRPVISDFVGAGADLTRSLDELLREIARREAQRREPSVSPRWLPSPGMADPADRWYADRTDARSRLYVEPDDEVTVTDGGLIVPNIRRTTASGLVLPTECETNALTPLKVWWNEFRRWQRFVLRVAIDADVNAALLGATINAMKSSVLAGSLVGGLLLIAVEKTGERYVRLCRRWWDEA